MVIHPSLVAIVWFAVELQCRHGDIWKSAQRDANTAARRSPPIDTESAMAVVRRSQNFPPPQTLFPEAQDRQNLISWRWSLPAPTDPVWWRSMHAISSYRGNRHRPPQTHKHRQDRLQYPAPLASAQCNKWHWLPHWRLGYVIFYSTLVNWFKWFFFILTCTELNRITLLWLWFIYIENLYFVRHKNGNYVHSINKQTNNLKWKSAQWRRKHCALAVVRRSQTFSPRRRPPSRGRRTAKI